MLNNKIDNTIVKYQGLQEEHHYGIFRYCHYNKEYYVQLMTINLRIQVKFIDFLRAQLAKAWMR